MKTLWEKIEIEHFNQNTVRRNRFRKVFAFFLTLLKRAYKRNLTSWYSYASLVHI